MAELVYHSATGHLTALVSLVTQGIGVRVRTTSYNLAFT